jgi:hypothetical protein
MPMAKAAARREAAVVEAHRDLDGDLPGTSW